MGDYSPPQSSDSTPFTSQASGTIVGGTLVTASGDGTCAASTTGDHSIGIASQDAVSGQKIAVWPLSGVIHEVTVQGVLVLAAGNDVIAGTTGFIKAGTLATDAGAGTLIGMCVKGATGPAKARFVGVA
jgi:hypothetical protein